jgi:hypothetical protein
MKESAKNTRKIPHSGLWHCSELQVLTKTQFNLMIIVAVTLVIIYNEMD